MDKKILLASGIKEINYIEDYKNNEIIEQINKNLHININKIK
jgi:deoxycytidylate deaminase